MKSLDTYFPKMNPILLGFFISLLGSLPLGYINVVGLQILLEQGIISHVLFVFGIVFIQFFVLKSVSVGAKWLVKQKNLMLFIDVFTVLFFALLSYYFFTNYNVASSSLSQFPLSDYPLVLGWFLNSLNFIQWPYWAGIYMYLFRTNRLQPGQNTNNIFITGVLVGTFVGMFVFANTTHFLIIQSNLEINKYFNLIFAVLFGGLAILQSFKLVVKKRSINA
jgi:threonine/homoserine/homoserine lactone efflux protein